MPAPSPLPAGQATISFAVVLAGQPLPDAFQVASLLVEQTLDRPSSARIAIAVTPETLSGFTSSAEFGMGRALEIGAGYDQQTSPIFTGRVATVWISSAENASSPVMTIDALGLDAGPPAPKKRAPVLVLTYLQDVLGFNLECDGQARGMARVSGFVRFAGSTLARPGDTLALAGFGARYDGNAFVRAVRHELAGGNWTTTAALGPAVNPVTD